jgi:hypothetical protein
MMPKRAGAEKRPTDTAGPAKPIGEAATSERDPNTPEEDALEKAARAVTRRSEAAQEASKMAHKKAEFDRLLEVRWENP